MPNWRRALFIDLVFLLRFSNPFCSRANGLMILSSYRAFWLLLVSLICSAMLGPAIARSSSSIAPESAAPSSSQSEPQVCDPQADYYLGMEDYPAAIHRHLVVIREHPDNALAHYHLGFAYGVIGQHQRELQEYRRAVDLGLDDWQVFLNLGLVYLEEGQLQEATQVLRLATLLGPYQAETHFNLGLTYERRGMLIDAEREMLFSLRLDPHEVDAHNMLGLIYAEEERYPLAREEWSDLLGADPAYTPARENLVILERAEHAGAKSASDRVVDFARGR
jgi:tetratricopeptide (TPR) repeat protein